MLPVETCHASFFARIHLPQAKRCPSLGLLKDNVAAIPNFENNCFAKSIKFVQELLKFIVESLKFPSDLIKPDNKLIQSDLLILSKFQG